MKATKVMILIIMVMTLCAFASSGEREILKRVALGEAQNQGLTGMKAVICATLNRRERIQGVYGVDNPIIEKEPAWVIRQAEDAVGWAMSNPQGCYELVEGADMWHSGWPAPQSWESVPMIFIKQIKDHYFYRRLKGGE